MKIVAELGANHNGSLDRALRIVQGVANAGADAIKLQTWTPGTMVLDRFYTLAEGPWAGHILADLYEEANTPREWHQPIFAMAEQFGIECFSSVFDQESLAFLETLDCPRYKIASFELVDLPLIDAVARTKKPIILSTGMATLAEIREAINTARAAGATDITVLKCTSGYPTPASEVNLLGMIELRKYAPYVGLSDHTSGIYAATIASAMGADMLEKHVTLNDGDTGLDAKFSISIEQLKRLVHHEEAIQTIIGKAEFGPTRQELPQIFLRRSLYFTKDIPEGTKLEPEHLVTARPALGLSPGQAPKIYGKTLTQSVTRGQPVTFEVIK